MARDTRLIEYLGGSCVNCGMSAVEMVRKYGNVNRIFKFHHVDPATKHDDYDKLIQRKLSTEQLDEVDKCVLLCGNCHDILHTQDNDGHVTFTVTIGDKTAEQTIFGNIIEDLETKTAKFISNERLYTIPYWLFIGRDAEPELVFGTELLAGRLEDLLEDLANHQIVSLQSYREEEYVFQVEYIDDDLVYLRYDIGFELPMQGDPSGKMNSGKGWIRNGVALLDDGRILTSGTVNADIDLPTFLKSWG